VNAVAPRGRTAARALLPAALAALAACSTVASVNDQAMQLLPDRQVATGPIDPSRLIRPMRTEYRIGARDVLEIEVYELEEPNRSKQLKLRVAQDGIVTLPLLGPVTAAGRTVSELHADLVGRLAKDYLVNPSVSVVVAEHQARRVTVLGAVQHPGTFSLQDNSTTLVDVLALAGGPDERAGSVVYVVRENGLQEGVAVANASSGTVTTAAEAPRLLKVDLVDLVERGDLSANCVLDDGDVVHVPPAAQFFVMGEVNEGGAFPLRGEITLLRAIALAGGLKENATPAATVLIRTTPKGRVTTPIDLNEVAAGSEKDVLMQADDVLVVNESGGDRTLRGIGAFIRGLFTISYGLR
jgi:polysaccharide export outer membrane protein